MHSVKSPPAITPHTWMASFPCHFPIMLVSRANFFCYTLSIAWKTRVYLVVYLGGGSHTRSVIMILGEEGCGGSVYRAN